MDLRFLILGALVPDIIDTPLGLARYTHFESVRLVGHSLLFAGVAMTWIVLATRRGRPRKQWMPIAIGILIHLFLDAMWSSPETLWWPLLGTGFSVTGLTTVGDYLTATVRDPFVWIGEVSGLGYLLVMARRAGLGEVAARRVFWRTGRINVPIGSSGP